MNTFYHAYKSDGKKTYYVNGLRFFNDKHKFNGKQKAVDYCLANFISPQKIIDFDSMLECDRYEYLIKQPNITDIEIHKEMLIQDSFVNCNGDTIPPITYKCDFVYKLNGEEQFEDVKGSSLTEDTRFEALKSMFDKVYQFKHWYIKIIIYRHKEWVEWHIGDNKKTGVSNKKAREERKALKNDKHARLVEDNKNQRLVASYRKLKALEQLTYAQKKRLSELETILKEKGFIL